MTALHTLRPNPAPRCTEWNRNIAGEPRLQELLADPCLHLLLRRDGLTLDDVRQVIATAQQHLRRGLCRRAA